jgi:hypothetical protein
MIGACVTAILVLVGVFAAASAASGQTLFRSDGLVAYDSTGKRVGTLSYAPNREVTFRTGAGRSIIVSVTPSYLFGNALLYFPQARCSGRPFLTRPNTGGQGSSFVGGPRQTVHVQEGAFSRRAMRSTRSPDGRCFNSASTEDFAPAVLAGIDLADYFTPPFVLRATPGEPIATGAVVEPLDPGDRLVVFDAMGKKVGATLEGSSPLAEVPVVTDSGMTMLLTIFDSHIGGEAFFEATDCTGPAFVSGFADGLLPATTLVGPRRSVHQRSGPATPRTMSSVDHGNGECWRLWGGPAGIGERNSFAPTSPVGIDLADYFTPPFTVRAGSGTRSLPKPN